MASPHHLKFDGVSFTYPGSVRRVLTDITFAVPSERVTGLIGENGAGKSTLLQLVAGVLEPDVGVITTPPVTGFIEQETQLPFSSPASEVIDAAVSELRDVEKQIGDLSSRLGDEPELADAFDAALATAEQSGVWELDSRIATVLAGLGLAKVPLETRLGEMSGGQRRRFALAALLLRPVDAMVLDEPTNHLDDEGVDFLISELKEFRGPVLVASHDRFFLDRAADSLVDLDAGLGPEGGAGEATRQGTVFTGSFTDYLLAREDIRRRWAELYVAQEHERARLEKATDQGESDIFHRDVSKSEVRTSAKFYADRAAKTLGNRLRSARGRLEALERDELPPPPARLKFHGIPEHTTLASLGEPAVVARDLWVDDRLGPLTVTIQPGETVFIPTGIALEVPKGCAGLVYARSSMGVKRGLAPANKVGVIDSDYRGEIKVVLLNHGKVPQTVEHGERVAQFLITPVLTPQYEEVEELTDTDRGTGGFGSTGK